MSYERNFCQGEEATLDWADMHEEDQEIETNWVKIALLLLPLEVYFIYLVYRWSFSLAHRCLRLTKEKMSVTMSDTSLLLALEKGGDDLLEAASADLEYNNLSSIVISKSSSTDSLQQLSSDGQSPRKKRTSSKKSKSTRSQGNLKGVKVVKQEKEKVRTPKLS